MRFTIKGTWDNSHPFQVTWEDGKLNGRDEDVALIETEAEAWEGAPLGPITGPFTLSAKEHLASPLSMVFLARKLLGEEFTVEGDIPEPPRTPKNSVQ